MRFKLYMGYTEASMSKRREPGARHLPQSNRVAHQDASNAWDLSGTAIVRSHIIAGKAHTANTPNPKLIVRMARFPVLVHVASAHVEQIIWMPVG